MKKIFVHLILVLLPINFYAQQIIDANAVRVRVANGILEGINNSGIFTFKGIPYAEPPIDELRWKAPKQIVKWEGVRKAYKFGPRAMQLSVFGDMNFRSDGMSEDCLYLNVWTPSVSSNDKLPVLVYFYGGGFVAGDGSEPRYDGESMARKGIVVVTINYRLGVFGFMAHPELSKESIHHASGNYGLMDQSAALNWVSKNVSVFGGDPKRITIAGESAGSISVSAQMISPLSKNLIAGAIGESGSIMGTLRAITLSEGEKRGEKFSVMAGVRSISDLRKISASQLLKAGANLPIGFFAFTIDGYFLPNEPETIYETGRQADVPLLIGWNSEEMNFRNLMGHESLTKENFRNKVREIYKDHSDEVLQVYNPLSEEEVEQVATDLSGDRFIGFSTWKWSDLHSTTSSSKVYRYYYTHPRPAMRTEMGNAVAGLVGGVFKDTVTRKPLTSHGAVHSAEIEYALGNLPSNIVFD